ncbi:hypothetical protein Tco_1386308 [Tanacetum coccineum]
MNKPQTPSSANAVGIVTQTTCLIMQADMGKSYSRSQTFFSHKASTTPQYNIHRRPESAVSSYWRDVILEMLSLSLKLSQLKCWNGIFPDPLITEAIQHPPLLSQVSGMVAEIKKTLKKVQACKKKKTTCNKHATPKKPTTTTPVKQSKPAPPPTKKPSKHKLPHKVRKGKPSFQLVDEDDEAQQESIPQEEGNDPDLEQANKMSLEAHQEKGEGEGDDADLERAIKLSLDPAFLPQGRAPVGGVTIRDPVSETTSKLHEEVGKGKAVVTEEQRTTDQFILVRRDQTSHDSTTGPSSQPKDDTSEKVILESSSTSDSERTESETETTAPKGDKDQGEVDSSTVTSGVSIPVSDPEKAHEALAGPDPEPMKEDQTGSDSGKLHVSLAGPNPEHMDDEFLATSPLPKVHENLSFITDERVIDDKTKSHSVHDQEKSKVREESESTIPDPNQTVTSTPPVIAPFTDVSSSKPSLLVTHPPINMEATTITTSLPEITPFIAHPKFLRLVDKYLGTKLDDALLKMKTPWIRKFARPVKIHKRKHDSDDDEDDDDDEGPSAGSNQGRSTKRRRSDSAASGSAQPPPKDDDQSSKKPRESDASATKQHPALSYNVEGFRSLTQEMLSNHREGNDSDMEDTDNAHIPKVSTTTWFKPIPESERPATPEPEWTIPPNDFPEPENNWGKLHTHNTNRKEDASAKLDVKDQLFNLVKLFIRIASYPISDDECHILLTISDKEQKIALSIIQASKPLVYLDFGLEEVVSIFVLKVNADMTSCGLCIHSLWNRVGDLQLGIESYQTKVNLERPNWDATDYYFKKLHDFPESKEPLSTKTEMIKKVLMS